MATYDSLTDRDKAAALIPEDVSRDIISALPASSAALSLFRRATMSRKVQRQPVLSTLPVAYWVDGDTGLKQTSELDWGNQYLTAEELAVIVPVPQAVLDDAEFDIWGEARPRLVEAFGIKIDAAALFGTDAPSSWPTSIVEGAIAAGNEQIEGTGDGTTTDFAADVSETMAFVEEDGFDVSAFWARRRVRAKLRGLRDDNGNPIYQPVAGGSPATLYGETLSFVSNGSWQNNIELIAGDPRAAILGIRQDITFQIFTEGVISDESGAVVLNLMQQDSVALRAVMRVGFAVANPMTRSNDDENSRYPFAVLVTQS
jgi:HK97 family phage major capsid protein